MDLSDKQIQERIRLASIALCAYIFLSAPACGGGYGPSGPKGGPSGPKGGPTGPKSGPTGPTGPTSTGTTGGAPGGPTGGLPGGTGKGYPPLITPQTDTGELMVPASPILAPMPVTGSATRPFYQTSGTAVDIRFRRQVDVTNLKVTFDVGYIGETTAP